MNATYIQDGDAVDHIPSTDLPLGAVVVLGQMVGIAHRAIPAGKLGSLAIEGIFDLPISPTLVFPAWSPVWWNPASGELTNDPALFPGCVRAGLLVRAVVGNEPMARVLINR
jgi:predicted RecA/RadA family phage recombinase